MKSIKDKCRSRGDDYHVYMAWLHARQRCRNPRDASYKNYGGRGVHFCEIWDDFVLFAVYMGPRPAGATLDRINNDGNYEPGNCEWASYKTQARHTQKNKLTAALVSAIKTEHIPGKNRRERGNTALLARKYGIHKNTILAAVRGEIWK